MFCRLILRATATFSSHYWVMLHIMFIYIVFSQIFLMNFIWMAGSFYHLESTLAVNECNRIRSIERYHFWRLFKSSSITLFIMSKLSNHIMCPQWLWDWNHVPCVSNYYICKSSAFVCISSYMIWENMKTV